MRGGRSLSICRSDFVFSLCMMALLFVLAIAAARAEEPVSKHLPLPAIGLADIVSAIDAKQPIVGREIQSTDLNAALITLGTHQNICDDTKAVIIQNSSIIGSLNFGNGNSPNVDDDAGDQPPDQIEPILTDWLPVAITIRSSSVSGGITLERVNVSCGLRLTDTTVDDAITFRQTAFDGPVDFTGSVLKDGLKALGVWWVGPVSFRGTDFGGAVEFILDHNRKSVFGQDADFEYAKFRRHASFLNTKFLGPTSFRHTLFAMDANFGQSEFHAGPRRAPTGPFYAAEFSARALFRRVRFKSLIFLKTVFHDAVDFSGARGEGLTFYGVTLAGRTDFDDARIERIKLDGFNGLGSMDGETIFRRAVFHRVEFNRILFRKAVHFEGTSVLCRVALNTVSFGSDLSMEDASFPNSEDSGRCPDTNETKEAPDVSMRLVTFDGPVYADLPQLFKGKPWWAIWGEDEPRLDVQGEEKRFWRDLERAFQKANSLELKNEADYRERHLAEEDQHGAEWLQSVFSRVFWGYGLAPLRVVVWAALMILVFAGVYWTQIDDDEFPATSVSMTLRRANLALAFSYRTAWQMQYGYGRSRTAPFAAITILESIFGKILIACFVYALAQASPLLSELAKKLLP
ncbi:hypothetical protein C1D09_003340 [Mesorhizobium intechi]|uniref:Pentapeptide repeat-containing protein n=1 Tax=Mesorhizobium intechi TaxID=537601 RepID=A0A8T9AZW3_9HYPH|nr:pentapeptide repeat-containing protein [Mesorhizobium intechi]TSE13522.1 hypothetical protein C1D09_003340 [Mesorhizobium intechi]